MTKEDDQIYENYTKCQICDNVHGKGNVKVRGHFQINGKHRRPVHRDCNIKFKLNHEISLVSHNLKNSYSHLPVQDLGKFGFKVMSYQMD